MSDRMVYESFAPGLPGVPAGTVRPWNTVYTRFRRYALDGVFTHALQQIQAHADAADDIDWLVRIRVHRYVTLLP